MQSSERSLHWIIFGLVLIFCGFLFLLSRIWLICYSNVQVGSALKQIDPGIPRTGSHAEEDTSEIILEIAANGSISIDESDPIKNLSESLKRLIETHRGNRLIVTVCSHAQTPYENVINVLNALAEAGIKDVTFTVGAEEF